MHGEPDSELAGRRPFHPVFALRGNVDSRLARVTDGELLNGVRYYGGGATTQSIVMRSKSGTVRMIEAYHRLEKLHEFSSINFDGVDGANPPLP